MNPHDLERLAEICNDFKKIREVTEDGQGNNLHDIKNTFDYVTKTIEEYQLTGTVFGDNIVEKAKTASKVLSQLWLSLQDIEKSINNFIDNQMSANNN